MTTPHHIVRTFVDYLALRSRERGSESAFVFLSDGEREADRITFAELARRAEALAGQLLALGKKGSRALILCPSSIEYIVAFYGCWRAGWIAVPAYPPRAKQRNSRLFAIAQDAEPTAILTTAEVKVRQAAHTAERPELASLPWLALDEANADRASLPVGEPPTEADLAVLQYTSGSTGVPRGVMLSHANLIANQAAAKCAFKQEKAAVSWLPLFHDMGIGLAMSGVYNGYQVALMPPAAFVQKPVRWLHAIHRYRADISGGPNFGYELCVRKVTAAQMAGLDLASWRAAFNGAEPVRRSTLEGFAEKFGPAGFARTALCPCFGMAESTLLIAAIPRDDPPIYFPVSTARLRVAQIAETAGANGDTSFLVSCGLDFTAGDLCIVDPASNRRLPEGQIGEIWVSGPSVGLGYWRREAETESTFRARPAEESSGQYLRTGDLGFILRGHLVFTGRIKDLIIVRGRNYYPHDLEAVAEAAHPALAPGGGAAFAIITDEGEGVVIVHEVTLTELPKLPVDEVSQAIAREIAEEHELQPREVVLVKQGRLPKTTSGKVRRQDCREAYLNGSLEIAARWSPATANASSVPASTAAAPTSAAATDQPLDHDPAASRAKTEQLLAWLRDYASRRLNSRVMDERRCITPAVVLDFGNEGLLGLQVPRRYDGAGLTHVDMMRVVEQIAAIDLSLATFVGVNNSLGVRPIQRYARPELREELLPALARGRQLASFAMTEPGAGSAVRMIASTGKPVGSGRWRLDGTKCWSGSAGWARWINVFVQLKAADGSPAGITGFVVPADTPGIRIGPEALTLGMRGMVQNTVYLEGAVADAAHLLGGEGGGMAVAHDIMMFSRLGIGAMALGGLKRCAHLCHRYASRRSIATGRLLDNPVTQIRLGEMMAAATAVEALIDAACRALDRGLALPEEVFVACKTTGPELLWTAADQLIQVLGGRGYVETNIAPQILRDARIFRIFEGPTETLNMYLGAQLMQQPGPVQEFLANTLAVPDVADRVAEFQAQISELPTPFADKTIALRWRQVRLGEVASLGILWGAARQRAKAQPTRPNETADRWARARFEEAAAKALTLGAEAAVVASADELTADLKAWDESICRFEQTLPGGDEELDPYLRSGFRAPLPTPPAEAAPAPTALPRASTTPSPHAATEVETWLRAWLVKHLRLSPEQISRDGKTFAELGVDSLRAMELAGDVEEAFGCAIDPTQAWNYPTVAAFAAYVTSQMPHASRVPLARPTPPVAPAPAARFDDLSETQLADLLRAELSAGPKSADV